MNQIKTEAREYLHSRGINDTAIAKYNIGGDTEKIIIPISGFNKYRTFPKKNYFYDKGFTAGLFGIQQLDSSWCVLTEGELDALRLASEDIPAVSGTGGAGTFKDEWVSELPDTVFICYDTDKVGKENALKVHWKLPKSRIVELPEGNKDITDYFKNHTKDEFLLLVREAKKVEKPAPVFSFRKMKPREGTDIERARLYPIERLLKLTRNKTKCIWHNEKTASLHLFPNNHIYCFGCSRSGDAIDVFMTVNGCDFRRAVEALQ